MKPRSLPKRARKETPKPDDALGHYGDDLLEFLTLRVGNLAQAKELLLEVRAELAEVPLAQLTAGPGIKPQAFRMAYRRSRRLPRRGKTIPWRGPRTSTLTRVDAERVTEAVARLRGSTQSDDALLLELRHSRAFSDAEIAFILGRELEDVEDGLARATETARAALDDGDDLPQALIHAFAIERLEEELDAPQPLDLPAGTIISERYELEERVGRGGFADVYRARDLDVKGHTVALKLLHREATSDVARAAALHELQVIAAVFHPSIVQFKDRGWFGDHFWFVMPWYEGETLADRVKRAPLSRAEAHAIFLPLARALATMHAQGVVHQDIKPDNVFLVELAGVDNALPVLIDLGVAATEQERVIAGTPAYFAPEAAARFADSNADGEVGAPADVFALALTLRNALAPDLEDRFEDAGAFLSERAVTSPSAPTTPDLRYLKQDFARWFHLDPLERPTADELADALETLTRPERRRQQRERILRWSIPLALLTLTAFTIVFVVLDQRAERERLESMIAQQQLVETAEELGDTQQRLQKLHVQQRMARRAASAATAAEQEARQERDRAIDELQTRIESVSSRSRKYPQSFIK